MIDERSLTRAMKESWRGGGYEVAGYGYRNEWYGKAGHGKIPQKVRDFCDRWEREVLAPWYAQRQERKNKQKRRKTSA